MKKILAISLLFITNSSTLLFSAASQKINITFATCAEKGNRRPTMEDRHHNDTNNQFFGIYDGHGGSEVAEKTKQELHEHILRLEATLSTEQALEQGFLAMHESIENQHEGTTATVAMLRNKTLYVANAGDSRAVLCAGGQALQMSVDHNPGLPSEKERIEKLSSIKISTHPSRIKTPFLITANQQKEIYLESSRILGLAVSRALGDRFHEGFVIPNPAIHTRKIDGTEEFLIIACDGLWDVVSNQAAVDLTKQQLSQGYSVEQCANFLVKKALDLLDHDNVTVTIICFNHDDKTEPSALDLLQEYSSQII
ncbi:protein serine/threonine phosphatase 2C family protein [bacterium]|nr:MAG: protein serine/threonine phosphatase 2C family protein [bacterium]